MGIVGYAVASNDALPDLEIPMAVNQVLAADDIFGVIADSLGNAITGGEISVFRIQENGPFDSAGIADISQQGEYILRRVVLGDFVAMVKAKVKMKNEK